MSVEIYAHCSIEVKELKNVHSIRSYSQCLIELRQYDIGQYRLHGIDKLHHLVKKNKSLNIKIHFRIQIEENNFYFLANF